jgi:TetR/AcrR family transcriptional regulator, regulator of cefoperazone and chloramphenicol sensitivity
LLQDLTKARLLEAAGEEFAANGFDGATIRSICARAGAKNIAAINYHFKDKEHLYEAALLEAHECSKDRGDLSHFEGIPPAERLRAFVRRFLLNVMEKDRRNTWHDALMLREMIQPSEASDTLVRESIRPRFVFLLATLRELCPDADDRRLHALAFSVVGQCLHYKVARPISVRLVGIEAYGLLDPDFLTDHITTMILAALGLAPPFCERAEVLVEKGGG